MCAYWRFVGGIAMHLLRSRARVQVDGDTQVEGQIERAVDLTPGNVDSLLQRLSGTTLQEM